MPKKKGHKKDSKRTIYTSKSRTRDMKRGQNKRKLVRRGRFA